MSTVQLSQQRSYPKLRPAFVLYVVLHHEANKSPDIMIRRVYKLKADAILAFRREYATWAGNEDAVYPVSHAKHQLSAKYLMDWMDRVKEILVKNSGNSPGFSAKGHVAYEIVHRDDKDMDEDDSRQRKVIIGCEETTIAS